MKSILRAPFIYFIFITFMVSNAAEAQQRRPRRQRPRVTRGSQAQRPARPPIRVPSPPAPMESTYYPNSNRYRLYIESLRNEATYPNEGQYSLSSLLYNEKFDFALACGGVEFVSGLVLVAQAVPGVSLVINGVSDAIQQTPHSGGTYVRDFFGVVGGAYMDVVDYITDESDRLQWNHTLERARATDSLAQLGVMGIPSRGFSPACIVAEYNIRAIEAEQSRREGNRLIANANATSSRTPQVDNSHQGPRQEIPVTRINLQNPYGQGNRQTPGAGAD